MFLEVKFSLYLNRCVFVTTVGSNGVNNKCNCSARIEMPKSIGKTSQKNKNKKKRVSQIKSLRKVWACGKTPQTLSAKVKKSHEFDHGCP